MHIVLHLDRYGTIETETGELCYHSTELNGAWNHVPVETVEPGDWVTIPPADPAQVTRVDTYTPPDPREQYIPKETVRQWVSQLNSIEFNLPIDTDGRPLRALLTEMREAIK